MPHKAFFVTDPDGQLHILHPAYKSRSRTIADDTEFEVWAVGKMLFEMSRSDLPAPSPMSDEELEHWRRSVHYADYAGPITATTCGECLESEVPTDRTFRGAWEAPAGVVQVNMQKARGIQMDKIRAVRNAELAAKDITFMRAIEAGDTSAQSTIATEKQVLRDIPQTFDLTTDTAEELKEKWPENLPKE